MKRLLLTLVLLSALGCTSLHGPVFVSQRTPIDCAIASLAMAAGTSYERVDAARGQLHVDVEANQGTPFFDIVAIAGRMGVRLVPNDHVNFLVDEGIVIVQPKNGALIDRADGQVLIPTHAVYLLRGMVYDPADTVPTPWPLKMPTWAQMIVFLQKR